MLDNLNLQDLFSSAAKTSEATVTATQAAFTPEILTTIFTNGLRQREAIEVAIGNLLGQLTAETAYELAPAIATLRNVSASYLPKL
jgi:hypothetical protein